MEETRKRIKLEKEAQMRLLVNTKPNGKPPMQEVKKKIMIFNFRLPILC